MECKYRGGEHDYRRLTTHAFLYTKRMGLIGGEPYYDRLSRPCRIGNDVWIGCNAVVCRGVTIGDGAVVGAGSVVTHDVEPYTIVAGTPARAIRRRFPRDIAEALLRLAWWEMSDADIRANAALFAREPTPDIIDKLTRIKHEKGTPLCRGQDRDTLEA